MKISLLVISITLFFFSCKTTKAVLAIPPPVPVVSIEPLKDTTPVPVVMPKPVQPVITGRTDVFLHELLKSRPEYFQKILDDRDSLRVQIIYTKIDRQPDNVPVFTSYYFNVNDERYFYPASTVKLPVALMALQRLNELKVFGLNSNSSMITGNNYKSQTPVFNDPTAPGGRPTIAQYVKKIFLVSDNDAFNRLYEFLGQRYINERLHAMGYEKANILHRLNILLSEEENRHTNAVSFFNETGNSLYSQPMQVSDLVYPRRTDSVGAGYLLGDSLVNNALSFSSKNRIGIEVLTGILRSVLFPASVPPKQRFNLREEDYRFLYKYMSQFPGETFYPSFDSSYHDAYLKFLLYGSQKDSLPKNIRIFNKSGDAYGFLTDVAYIADFDKNIEFMLSATIYCNSDGILNDDKYDYETIGFPFMKQLGTLIYDYESKRERVRKPDLSGFKIKYDK